MAFDSRIDEALLVELSGLSSKLRALRLTRAGLSQETLGMRLRVAGQAVSDWELGHDHPTLAHLLNWCNQLDARLVIMGPGGQKLRPRLDRRAGEGWAGREARRLATALRAERRAARRTQPWLARRLGVTYISVNRWENSNSTPRVLVLAQWSAAFGCALILESRFSVP